MHIVVDTIHGQYLQHCIPPLPLACDETCRKLVITMPCLALACSNLPSVFPLSLHTYLSLALALALPLRDYNLYATDHWWMQWLFADDPGLNSSGIVRGRVLFLGKVVIVEVRGKWMDLIGWLVRSRR